MNTATTTEPDSHPAPLGTGPTESADTEPPLNGHNSPEHPIQNAPAVTENGPADDSVAHNAQQESAHAQDEPEPPKEAASDPAVVDGGNDDGQSEAETLISTPVKKREAEKQQQHTAVKTEKPARSRIGGLPVPGEDDDESESIATPVQSTETNEMRRADGKDGDGDVDMHNDKEDSEPLSSPHPTEDFEQQSRSSSRTRAESERPQQSRDGADSPNPRKRKHRASSVGLPNKRQSVDPPKSKLRGMYSEDLEATTERSLSPKLRSHRRAVSTQSTLANGDGAADGNGRKRRAMAQFPVRDPRPSKAGWEESDASSETTSHGQAAEVRRAQRGVGRSTSTPGRQGGREHKRHINKYGFTKLAEACENDDLEQVKEWRERDPDQLELAEFAGNKPLQIAALKGNAEIVAYLIDQGCQIDCANVDKDTPLIDASENGHLAIVKMLLSAGVDPLRQNLKGQQALDVVTDDTDDCDDIRAELRKAIESWNSSDAKLRREEEEEQRHRAGPSKSLQFMARTYENLLALVQVNDRNGVREFLDARVPVDNNIIAAAAKTGDQYLVNMLLAEMSPKKAMQKTDKPMLAVIGTSHFEMLKMLTSLDNFNPLHTTRSGKTWIEVAEERNGPNRRQEVELLQQLHDDRSRQLGRRSSSPVTKRDYGKRRPVHDPSDEDSDEGQQPAPKRKNGRRLMSRRDMRAASGKPPSDTESEKDDNHESTTDDAPGEPDPGSMETMKAPTSPKQRRNTGRSRTNSFPNTPQEPISPRSGQRRSSSLRKTEQPLPTLEEKEDVGEGGVMEKQRRIEAQLAIEEAQRQERQRQEAKEAEAEACRAEEAAKRKAEEDERRAEERRQKEAEEQARRDEDARRAEAAERAEEERKRRVIEMENARSSVREEIIAALPWALRQVVNSTADNTDAFGRAFYLAHFTPLIVVREDYEGSWILNVQAAPLLGKRGLELLLPRSNYLDFETTYSRNWPTIRDFSDREIRRIAQVHDALTLRETPSNEAGGAMTNPFDFQVELSGIAARVNAIKAARKKLSSGMVPLFCVRLEDVMTHLNPAISDAAIDVQGLSTRFNPGTNAPVPTLDGFFGSTKFLRMHQAGKLEYDGYQVVDRTETLVVHQETGG
ncbi:Ankyrin repeat domain-containing protein 11 [Teratosphaeria destructans]|uniref:Ankyrin repeat domain-containing protein 11 n=1 Tax=Teratosphaeria destructans TaxID=418781 RepID=A0A9W7SXT2_9PEZI|nr:Ankyrin repeat domain-containing protein 11 [Teratosphaeria destructans]